MLHLDTFGMRRCLAWPIRPSEVYLFKLWKGEEVKGSGRCSLSEFPRPLSLTFICFTHNYHIQQDEFVVPSFIDVSPYCFAVIVKRDNTAIDYSLCYDVTYFIPSHPYSPKCFLYQFIVKWHNVISWID